MGCDPFNAKAVQRVLDIKQRSAAKGMIVIAASLEQALPHLNWEALPDSRRRAILSSWPGPNTWLIPCQPGVPNWLRGEHDTLAVRVTAHPVAADLCRAFGGLVVSTSANRAGEAAAQCIGDISTDLLTQLDGWVAGDTDGRARPSTIRDARSGAVVRAA